MKHIHLIGIGGTGLSAIAQVLLEQGYTVSGSDRESSPLFKAITSAGARTSVGHMPENITGADLVIRSSAIPDDNPEVAAAIAQGIPVLKRRDFLAELTQGKQTLAVAGSHGKTTTTALLIWILHQLGTDPSFISGGVISQLGCNAHSGKGPYFVIEADEYDYMFLGLTPNLAIVTNMEHDHPDCFPTRADYQAAFEAFIDRIQPSGKAILCADDIGTRSLFTKGTERQLRMFSYGTGHPADYRAVNITFEAGFPRFDLEYRDEHGQTQSLGTVNLKIPGHHNVLNAAGALAAIHQLGLSVSAAIDAVTAFTGAGRRFEILGQGDGVTIIDDYGHHPTEMAATLAAARTRYPGHRIWAVWQPHTFTRTQNLAADFAQALQMADRAVVLKIYASRETDPGYSAASIVDALPAEKAAYAENFEIATQYLLNNLAAGDIVIVFSAGDATQLSQMVFTQLNQRKNEVSGTGS